MVDERLQTDSRPGAYPAGQKRLGSAALVGLN
jgi:hypothetical protein